jgi:aspartate 1-decarboxylase
MKRIMCKSKIHRARVTDANLDYEGSVTIDGLLLDAADIREYEQVHVVNIANGARFETYAMRGADGSGDVVVNGAAARLVQPGDKVIIFSYASYDEAELETFAPVFVFVDDANRIEPRATRRTA